MITKVTQTGTKFLVLETSDTKPTVTLTIKSNLLLEQDKSIELSRNQLKLLVDKIVQLTDIIKL